MEYVIAGDKVGRAIDCGLLMTIAGMPWSFGLSAAGTPIAGIAFNLGWSVFSSWVCSHV